jgi:deoxyguanosine kinase
MNKKKPISRPLFWVEGIIGCGKTTFCREVGKRLKLRVIEEPVAENPYLAPFYDNPADHAFAMQIFLLGKRHAMQQLAAWESTGVGGYGGAMLDRSLAGDRVFAKLHRDAGNITALDWETYEMWYDIACRNLLPPTRIIYLDASPETALERIRKRTEEDPKTRGCESKILLPYLQQLEAGYHALLAEARVGLLPWAHAITVKEMVWDPINDHPDWDRIANNVAQD